MSLSPHQRANSHIKPNAEGIEELGQTSDEAFYNLAAPLEHTNSAAAGRTDPGINLQTASGKADKGYQVWGHFQQSGPVKWANQDPVHTNWFSHKVTQNFGPGMDEVRGQGLLKSNLDLAALQQQKILSGSSVLYSDSAQPALPGMDWDPHGVAAMQHVQFPGHKPGDQQYQSQVQHSGPDSTLQSFQVAFGPTKQLQASGFFQSFQGSGVPQSLGYAEQSKSSQQQQQLLQMQHQQQMHHFHQQQQHQQRLHLQQQYHHQQKMQEQMQRRQQKLLQPGPCPPQPQHQQHDTQLKADFGTSSHHRLPTGVQPRDSSSQSATTEDPSGSKAPEELQQTNTKADALPRRSRRLSKDGQSPPTNHPFKDPAQNGGVGGPQGPSEGVIHSTPRRRRTSKEINLVTLAQKASEMEFLPAKQQEEGTANRQAGMAPLVMPVSVPVRRGQFQAEHAGSWRAPTESSLQLSERKPSVIVTRRRSLRATETLNKDEEAEDGQSPEKMKRRPRPGPLVIPPPKPCTFIAPPIYSTISPFPSNLRSPVRLIDNPLTLPPYTPPPILSPVREGSGLYFSTFLSSIAAGNQGLPLPPTPKTASRSLLRSSSSEVTPPMPPLIGEATPVSLEPRINIGVLHQAEIPELRDRALSQQDEHKATLVWLPLAKTSGCQEETVINLMNLACSSVLHGGGANVELTHHCLHENSGDVLKTLDALLLRNPIFPKDHHLSNYHYSGSDCWSVDEKRYFNKGISAYRKDFYLVQKVVQSKTLAQCVEFYYTYKKQVKVGRSGILVYGPPNSEDRAPELQVTQIKPEQPEDGEENKEEDKGAGAENVKGVTRTLQESKVSVLTNPMSSSLEEPITVKRETQTPPFATPKPRPESAARRSVPTGSSKSQGEPEGIFPCKKCNRVFYKVKSRSAHMKSHAEQEKKAAAQRQREEEERRAMWARLEAPRDGQGGDFGAGVNVRDEGW